ncbi:LysR family transcriptional regulator [Pseudomonas sp. PDM32]|uniref:LysR family transcriptional regulator n=1 Tax=Pseudomonas sp. PDM32 TaxID=2854768 RepID=UPI001C472878|nr:LysR family transcriptional regulator [Pseudomonas sp. PDM32]MBV7573274.1 LysR family transcriptional regulator [Pseudomonas sp. PDM32]
MVDIRKFDLNLLPILEALLIHQNVSRAADELEMSQSAVSAALGRLRVLLGDDLLVRTGRGMRPTARALELKATVSLVLDQVRDELMSSESFNPAESTRSIILGLSEVGCFVLGARITKRVRTEAPNIQLKLTTLSTEVVEDALERGGADLALGPFECHRSTVFQRRLYERHYVCLAAKGSTYCHEKMTLAQFAQAPQLVVKSPSRVHEVISQELAEHGHTSANTMEIPSFLHAPMMLETGEFISVVPGQLADVFTAHWDLQIIDAPMVLPLRTIRLFWHRRSNTDHAIRWLRNMIVDELTSEIFSLPGNI